MDGKNAALILRSDQHFLDNILADFTEQDADFQPTGEMMNVAQQVHHIAHTIDWFREGAFTGNYDMDFEAQNTEAAKPRKLSDAKAELAAAYARLCDALAPLSAADMAKPMPDNPILGPAPLWHLVPAVIGHTSHHRGALSVYLRLLGRTPRMVYS